MGNDNDSDMALINHLYGIVHRHIKKKCCKGKILSEII